MFLKNNGLVESRAILFRIPAYEIVLNVSVSNDVVRDEKGDLTVLDRVSKPGCIKPDTAKILDRKNERKPVETQQLDRIYPFVNRRLYEPRQQSAANSADTVQVHTHDLGTGKYALSGRVKFERDLGFGPAGEIDTADYRQ